MKHFILRAFKLILAVLFPGLLFAQTSPDFNLLLHSGKFTPQENVKTLNKNAEVLQKSLFNGKYYLTLQFKTLPDQQEKVKLGNAGIQLIDYIPNLAYTATIPQGFDFTTLQNFPVRSVYQLNAAQKTVPALLQANFPPHAIKQPGFIDVSVITYEKLNSAALTGSFAALNASILEEMPQFRTFTVRVPQTKIVQLINLPFVQWVEPIDAPNVPENLLGRSLHRVNVLNDGVRNLKGDGINVGIWDEGEVSPHLDFTPLTPRLHQMETSAVSSHTTHVAGTIGGRGIINPKARGMAPNATLYSYNFNGNITSEMAAAIPAYDLVVSSHSYGSTQTCGITGAGVAYSSTSRSTDLNLNNFPSHLHVHSAGNSQTACTGGWSTITGSGKTAKNNILVANITSTEGMSGSSSFGPVADGRVKPEISSLGTNVLSTYIPLNTYGTISGTSMATPGVSGSVALLVQRYKQLNNNIAPISSLIKAAVCNTAADLGNPGPDYKFGFGRINALAAVKALEQNRYAVNTITTGATNNITVTVPPGAIRMKVMLTWNDPAGTVNAVPALVNNLDLSVISGASTTLPWILNPNNPALNATRGVDNVSNIEQVTIDNPTAGTYTLRVNGTAVPTGANQQYSLTWEIDQPFIEVTFPNGGEAFSPGSQETITWDNAGVTANQTIQYSVNNGTTWVTISSTVPAATTRYAWTVPAGLNTATALIRVFSNTLSDDSDANFRILGTPAVLNAGPGICPGTISFSWAAVTNATHYNLYSLDLTTGQWVNLASNISGTSYTANGLTPGASMWFTLTAKNNTTGAESDRTLAINRTVSGGSGLSLGAISGYNSICDPGQLVTYSVTPASGATNYVWTLPAGASVVSGQGTNAVTVSFAGFTNSGAVSVFASNGSCQSNTSTLQVSMPSSMPVPVSGGDQVSCFDPALPYLTASATVPNGFLVVWYTTPTGGNTIVSPTLNGAGTATFYAASRTVNGNCESTVRTPVTLTLNNIKPATMYPNGTIRSCEGDSVLFTASPGVSYLWNTGARTRNIVVRQTGVYSVTITDGNGCSSTSPLSVVELNQRPKVTLTASLYTELNPGLKTTLFATTNSQGPVTYSWLRDGKSIPGKTGETLELTIDDLGEYAVTVTNSDNCSATSETINIGPAASDALFIYPNPNTGQFQVRYNNKVGDAASNLVTVYDSKGARVMQQQFTLKNAYNRMDIDLSKQSRGIYFVVLTNDNGKKVGAGRVILF